MLYDRAGTGWSDQVDLPRTATEVADELRRLLHAVLLDPGHEDIFSFLPGGSRRDERTDEAGRRSAAGPTDEQIQSVRGQFEGIYAQWPDSVRVPLIEHKLTSWRTSLLETANETEVFDELRRGGGLPDVPLIVLTARGRNPYWAQFMSEQQMQEAHDGISALHAAMASSVSQGEPKLVS
ncbi:MAG: hypothetical protein QOG10_1188 [Kribbellaceae bacterium]|nr:hypothetical protein [Kribbellaceae bacterium]